MRLLTGLLAAAALATPVAAKPLVTSSEDTHIRVCLAREDVPSRIVEACDAALTGSGLTRSQRAEVIVARGDGHLWQKHLDAAISSYREAIGLDPRSTEAWNGLGWALWEADGDAAAHEAFDRSLGLGVSVQGLGGKAATARRSGLIGNDEARGMLRAALTIDPDYIWAVREIGWSYLDDREPARAAEEFRAAMDIEPRDVNARYGLGRAQLDGGDAEAALDTFNDVLMDAPEDFSTLAYRIIALRRLDRNAQALRQADRLIEAFPDKSSGYIERGQALMALGRRGDAIRTYSEADGKLGPNNAVLYWYADALSADGQFENALAVIDRGIALAGADYSDHLLRSYIALELQDYPLARTAAEASLATGVEDPWAHYYIAISLVHEGAASEGMAWFEKAIATGLPADRIGAFASELVGAGKWVEAAQLRLKY
ncbi:MAG: tetratricopeptide repeat protein [Silicimonas sp.]|nr:tetratricopeptide repeat protein [Silicimonas sp.]